MVQVRRHSHGAPGSDVDLAHWLQVLPVDLSEEESSTLLGACQWARQSLAAQASGSVGWAVETNCFVTGLDITVILADLNVGLDCLVAGVLYRAVREDRVSVDEVTDRFGDSVGHLLRGVLRMAALGDLRLQRDQPVLGQALGQKDNVRQLLIALVDDVQVALIKLAERTCALRAAKENGQRRDVVAREVFDVYAPLAHRLGIGQLKWELEDLSFRYLYPDAYRKIAGLLDGKRLERDQYIADVSTQLTDILANAGLSFEIDGRAKHIYSIWQKMQRKGIGFSQVYDMHALRILVPEVKDCYATLGLVHGVWRNVANEFDDYIANPKENGYRSLHTAVVGPQGKVLEVQIRTRKMHEESELGVCAHWRYKGSDVEAGMASTYEEKIAWLRKVLDLNEYAHSADIVVEQLSFDIEQDRVYVFTPSGDVVNLANGATPLDFAYHVHTEIGNRCRGAKVDGAIVPLTYTLETGQRVEILTHSKGVPRRDWLQPELGFLVTSRARASVQQWFRSQNKDDQVDAGRHLLDRELKRLALTSIDYQRLAHKVGVNTVEDMYASVGAGDLSSAQALNAAQEILGSLVDQPQYDANTVRVND